jgi:hypothetical protein
MLREVDFTFFYKKYYKLDDLITQEPYDIFISAYNNSDRVQKVYEQFNAQKKIWLILPEYKYAASEIPEGENVFVRDELTSESEYILELFKQYNLQETLATSKACIDLTGLSRAHLIFFFRYIQELGIKEITTIYTDPLTYIKNEKTVFSSGHIDEVRQILLCEGLHNPDFSNDFLIIGSGYDYSQIIHVASYKEKAKKVQVFGFPPLKPHMYQENILQVINAKESIGGHDFIHDRNALFAPANDPFVTAQVLKDFIERENERKPITNLYLCPLSTKAQTLGFVLYYIWECINKPVSIIHPFSSEYARETTKGVSRIAEYKVVLP